MTTEQRDVCNFSILKFHRQLEDGASGHPFIDPLSE